MEVTVTHERGEFAHLPWKNQGNFPHLSMPARRADTLNSKRAVNEGGHGAEVVPGSDDDRVGDGRCGAPGRRTAVAMSASATALA